MLEWSGKRGKTQPDDKNEQGTFKSKGTHVENYPFIFVMEL